MVLNTVPRGLVFAVAYGALWLALFLLSHQLWFLPAGLRLATLWLLPTRSWGWCMLGEYVVLFGLNLYWGQPFQVADFFALNIFPWLIYAAAIAVVRGSEPVELPDAPRRILALLGAGLLAAALTSPVLSAFYQRNGPEVFVSLAHAFAFLYGDFLGQLVVAPLLLLLASAEARARLDWKLWGDLTVLCLVSLGLLVWLGQEPELAPYLLMLAFAPMFALAFRRGWEGAVLASAVVGVLLEVMVLMGEIPLDLKVVQLGLAVIGAGALVLGAAVSALHRSHAQLAQRHDELRHSNAELSTMAIELRQVSQRLVRIEEQGQRELAGELEYEIGQAIHALGTRISLAFRDSRDEQTLRLLESLREQVREIQDSLRRALRQLRPTTLDTAGLGPALAQGPLRDILEDAGIEFELATFGRIEAINDDDRTALYRICQLMVREAVRSEVARRLTVKLDAMPLAMDRLQIELQMDLEYSPFAASKPPVEALPGVSDRSLAQHAHYRVEAMANGVRHTVQFESACDS